MAHKKRKMFAAAACILVIGVLAAVVWENRPERRAERFIERNGAQLAALVDTQQPLPEMQDVVSSSEWNGEHSMYEWILSTWGNTYYGCYYSPDDVPLPFQNSGVALIEDGKGCWRWKAEGDNQGMTKKLEAQWYYFKASF